MLSCQRDVAAMVLHDAAAPKLPWVVIDVNDGDAVTVNDDAYVKLRGTLTRVGNRVLAKCESPTAVDLSGVTSLRQVGNFFLFECFSLTAVDLSGLVSLTQVDVFLNC